MVIPVEQTCPKCGSRFMGSDCIGDSCSSCRMGYLDLSLDYLMQTDSPAQPEAVVQGLIPPDFSRCQASPNVARHSPFSLGPMPKPIRCSAVPVWLAVETKPGDDGLHGSMTLCQPCAQLMFESRAMRERVQLQPLLSTPAQPEEPSDAPCNHPSYSWSALGVTCAHCGAEGWHAAHGEIVWRLHTARESLVQGQLGGGGSHPSLNNR